LNKACIEPDHETGGKLPKVWKRRAPLTIIDLIDNAWTTIPGEEQLARAGTLCAVRFVGVQPSHPSLSLTRTHAGERTKMNSARTRFCRGTPRPPHGLYVGAPLMQLDSTRTFTEGKKIGHLQQFGIIHLSNPDLIYIRMLRETKLCLCPFTS
jgi:hypothetical protein